MPKQSTACQQGKINMLNTKWNWDDAKKVWQEEAREEKSSEIAKKALSKGMDISIIQELTGLDIDVINGLSAEQDS
jgi:hypothetical protein